MPVTEFDSLTKSTCFNVGNYCMRKGVQYMQFKRSLHSHSNTFNPEESCGVPPPGFLSVALLVSDSNALHLLFVYGPQSQISIKIRSRSRNTLN